MAKRKSRKNASLPQVVTSPSTAISKPAESYSLLNTLWSYFPSNPFSKTPAEPKPLNAPIESEKKPVQPLPTLVEPQKREDEKANMQGPSTLTKTQAKKLKKAQKQSAAPNVPETSLPVDAACEPAAKTTSKELSPASADHAPTPINTASPVGVPESEKSPIAPPPALKILIPNNPNPFELDLESTLMNIEAMQVDSPIDDKPQRTPLSPTLLATYQEQLTQLEFGFAALKVQCGKYTENKPEDDAKVITLRNFMQEIHTALQKAKTETQDTAQVFRQLELSAMKARSKVAEHRNTLKGWQAKIIATLDNILHAVRKLIGIKQPNTINGLSEKWVVRTFFEKRTTSMQYIDTFRKCVHETHGQSLSNVSPKVR